MSPESEASSCALAGPVVSPQACPHSPTQQAGGTGDLSHTHLSRHLAIPALGLPACRLPHPNPPLRGGPREPRPPASLLGLCCPTGPHQTPGPCPQERVLWLGRLGSSLSPASSVTFGIPDCGLLALVQPFRGQGFGLSTHRFECLQGQAGGEGLWAAGMRPCLPGAIRSAPLSLPLSLF